MRMDWSLDVGQLLTIGAFFVALIGAHVSLKTRMDHLEKALDKFGERLAKHEGHMMELVGQVQRVIGELSAHTRNS